MCDAILLTMNNTYETVAGAISGCTRKVSNGLNYLGAKVDDLTNALLPPTAARIVAKSIKSLPVTLTLLFTPPSIRDMVFAVTVLTHVFMPGLLDKLAGKPMRQAFFRGASDFQLVAIGVEVSTLFSQTRIFSIWRVAECFLSAFIFYRLSERQN